ncbi:MAG: hypothetical protein CR991_03910 [Proteobacteria bacterium]|nr:MAG: hypothetical protein CR991_03910 [Pseudomonadota bacterium]
MLKIHLLFSSLVCLWLVAMASYAYAGWVWKQGDLELSEHDFQQVLEARGLQHSKLEAKPQLQQSLLQELFVRAALLQQDSLLSTEQEALIEKQVVEYRKNQRSLQVLDKLARQNMPNFEKRAKELYLVHKDNKYSHPLLLRVRVIQKKIKEDKATSIALLEQIRTQVSSGELDFIDAVKQYSDAPDKSLAAGDSFWFTRGQKPPIFFQAAEVLSAQTPLSSVFVWQDAAYLLQFLDRQEPTVQTYAEVCDSIIAELSKAYVDKQKTLLLDELKTRFQKEVELNPSFQ